MASYNTWKNDYLNHLETYHAPVNSELYKMSPVELATYLINKECPGCKKDDVDKFVVKQIRLLDFYKYRGVNADNYKNIIEYMELARFAALIIQQQDM